MSKTEVKRDWVTEAGLRAVVLFVHGSHHCGYVAVPKGHCLHGVEYSDEVEGLRFPGNEPIGGRGIIPILCSDPDGPARPDVYFDVHGGLTYSGRGGKYPAEGDDLWWFGFDCAHLGDLQLGRMSEYAEPGAVFRDADYVSDQCESLATQLAGVLLDKVSEAV